MAFGLPVEGDDGPFAGDELAEMATCGPDDAVDEVLGGLDEGDDEVVVVNERRVVLGTADRLTLERSSPDQVVADVMALSPSTIRPSVELSSLAGADSAVLVTDADGRLMGAIRTRSEGAEEATDPELQQLQGTFLEVVHALEEHFEGEDPSEEQVRAFLLDRLVAEGRTPEEAEAYLAEMGKASE